MTELEQTPAVPALPEAPRAVRSRPRAALIWLGLAALVLATWLLSTPPGLLGKADAIGYAVCHRIQLRSFLLGERQFPLCARCTGMYLGALFGMLAMALSGRARAGGLPPRPVLVALGALLAFMGVDGVNSFLTLFPGLPHLYEPQNWLRLLTGTLAGLTLAALIYPVFNQTLWQDWIPRPVVADFRELGRLVLLALALTGLVLSDIPAVLYPLALLSAAGVLAMLTALFTTVFLIVTRRENRVRQWTGALPVLLAGLTLAVAEIGLVDAARFAVFGTWSGFVLPG